MAVHGCTFSFWYHVIQSCIACLISTLALFVPLCPGVVGRNEARSQQMVAEELARIVQSELAELRQRNVEETTTRIRLENQLGEL